MGAQVSSDLSQKDRIAILMGEYATLRAELIARTSFGFQTAAVLLTAMTWFVSQSNLGGRHYYFWLIVGFIGLGFASAIFVNVRDLKKIARRLKEIEHEVNSRAGEHLLVWETLSGVFTRMRPWQSFLRPAATLPREFLPALDATYLQEKPETPLLPQPQGR